MKFRMLPQPVGLFKHMLNPYLTGKSSESSTVGPREPWLDLAVDPADLGRCKSVEVAGENV